VHKAFTLHNCVGVTKYRIHRPSNPVQKFDFSNLRIRLRSRISDQNEVEKEADIIADRVVNLTARTVNEQDTNSSLSNIRQTCSTCKGNNEQ